MLPPSAESPTTHASLAIQPWPWLPVPVLALAALSLGLLAGNAPFEVWPILVALYLVFYTLASLVSVGFLARAFLRRGSPGLLLLCAAMAVWGLTGAASVLAGRGEINLRVTILDLGIWCSALCHLAGAILEAQGSRKLRRRRTGLALVLLGVAALLVLTAWSARSGGVVPFFIQGQGGTLARQTLLVSSMATFATTGLLPFRREGPAFTRWYRPALWLIAVGLGANLAQAASGSALSWAGRGTLCLAGVYLVLAARGAGQGDRNVPVAGRAEGWGRLTFVFAVLLVVAATTLRMTFLQVLGHAYLFISYFPAVVLAGLLGGLWAGLLASVLSALVASYLWMNSGVFLLPRSQDWLGMSLFFISCLLISLSIEAMHRAKARAAEAEAQARASAIREEGAQALQRTVEELTRSNRELEQFAYVASHDLQEPLRMVHAYVDLLAQRYRGRLDHQADQYIFFALEGSTRMRSLIHDLLAYSRLGAPGQELLVPMDLQPCLDLALAGLRGAMDETGAAVTWDPLPRVVADPVLMAQLFHNLVGNALKFRGAQAPRIHVGAQVLPSAVQVSVQDNGIGIDPEARHKVFDLFQRLHTREAYPGTGIGLTMCRKIVERHGGRIWVDSMPGEGAVFHFTLPHRQGVPS